MWPFGRPDVVDGHYIGDRTPSTRAEPPPPSPRSATSMSKDQLTAADMAEHRVTLRNPGPRGSRTVRAAYIASDAGHPDMLIFKDSEHRVVYMVSRSEILDVERTERGETVPGVKVEITEYGDGRRTPFAPTSEAMRAAGIKPEDLA